MTQELKYPSTLSIYKRIANLGLAIAALIVAANLWVSNVHKEQLMLQQQADQLGHSLLGQAANLLEKHIDSPDQQPINEVLLSLQQDLHVQSAAMFKANGELLAGSNEHLNLVDYYQTEDNDDLLIYVHTIKQDHQIKGFLRLLLHRDKVVALSQEFQQQQQQQIPLMLSLALLMGILITRAFYKLKYKHYSIKKEYHS